MNTSISNLFHDEDDEIFGDFSFLMDLKELMSQETTKRTPVTTDKSLNETNLNVSALCCDENIKGYDKITGKTWIYPTNYPVRDYQFNIIRTAILKNTLVSLPTGLGKTFIAAVIMYNFYRWYPLGKIVFTAPTRPLVAQQIEACYSICAIPSDDTIEMTGHMQVNIRKKHWMTKRVFFATPQVIYNDLKSGICHADQIRCLVIDEAHRARGNYAYCQIISTLTDKGHTTYRVLALSATPGSKLEDVVNVVKNLHIAHLELRTENSIDVAPYSHIRKINTVLISLGEELNLLRKQYVEILDGYARRLKQLNILPQNIGNLSKGRIVVLYKDYQNKERGARHPQHKSIMKDFTVLISLYHGLELLVKHGSRVFLNFFDEHPEKSWIQADDQLTALLERLRDDLGVNPMSLNRSILPDGTIPEIPKDLQFGHPKFCRLKNIMLEHFNKSKEKGQDTKAIVFCEYRESVNLVHCLLLQCRPLIRPQMFVGQGKKGKTVVSQKQQLQVMRRFRDGDCNALVATCVAEEGLDVGSVDLIVCFDVSTRSPVRLVQRCGRTGRERSGQVYILVTEGREHQTLVDSIRQRDGLNKKILQSKEIENNLYKLNHRMMPEDHMPDLQKMHITVTKKPDPKCRKANKSNKGQKDLRTMLIQKKSPNKSNALSSSDSIITKEEFEDLFSDGYYEKPYFEEIKDNFPMCKAKMKALIEKEQVSKNNLTPWLEWQRSLQSTANIGHSSDCKILTETLQHCDAKRFQLPASTQNPNHYSQALLTQNQRMCPTVKRRFSKMKQKNSSTKSPVKKNGDIRALFTPGFNTKSYKKAINDLQLQHESNVPTVLLNLLVEMSIENTFDSCCTLCKNTFYCFILTELRNYKLKEPRKKLHNSTKYPDINLLDTIDIKDIQEFVSSKKSRNKQVKNISSFIDEQINSQCCDSSCNSAIRLNVILENECLASEKLTQTSNNNFNIGSLEEIFDSSSMEATDAQVGMNLSDPKETLKFFGLDSIDDIFAGSDDSIEVVTENVPEAINEKKFKANQALLSPSVLSGTTNHSRLLTSPIISSQRHSLRSRPECGMSNSTPLKFNLKRKQLFKDKHSNDCQAVNGSQSKQPHKTKEANVSESNNSKSLLSITETMEIINKTYGDMSKITQVPHCDDIDFWSFVDGDIDTRSQSPILLTQADRRINAHKSFTIPETESDSDNPVECDMHANDNTTTIAQKCPTPPFISIPRGLEPSPPHCSNVVWNDNNEIENIRSITHLRNKRKELEDITGSPYFNKKLKPNHLENYTLSLQAKIKSVLSLNKNDDTDISPLNVCLKENCNSYINCTIRDDNHNDNFEKPVINIVRLQCFRKSKERDKVIKINKHSEKVPHALNNIDFNVQPTKMMSNILNSKPILKRPAKKKRIMSSLIDAEAEVSGSASGSELSDSDTASLEGFICDTPEPSHEDTHAYYLRSIRVPVNGVFKIPRLPELHENIFSQTTNEQESSNYEIDSFCVDSNVGLTQDQELSDLERAEMKLEAKKILRKKKKTTKCTTTPQIEDDTASGSPELCKVSHNRRRNRQIHSDSDDSG